MRITYSVGAFRYRKPLRLIETILLRSAARRFRVAMSPGEVWPKTIYSLIAQPEKVVIVQVCLRSMDDNKHAKSMDVEQCLMGTIPDIRCYPQWNDQGQHEVLRNGYSEWNTRR